MSHVGEAYYTSSVPFSTSLGIGTRPVLDPSPASYQNVRLTNGNQFYSAGFSGSTSFTTVDQGNAGLLSQAWPIKLSDGTNVFGTPGQPLNVVLASGGLAAGVPAQPLWVTGSVAVNNQPTSTTTVSGSLVGLLVGGQPLSFANPAPVTISGSFQTATAVQSGSVVGLLVGGVPHASTNPLWVTGTVRVENQSSTTTTLSGSVVGFLVGGQPVSQANAVPITGTVVISGGITQGAAGATPWLVTGSVRADQGTSPWAVTGSVSLSRGVSVENVVTVTGSVRLTEAVTVASGSVTGLLVGGQPLARSNQAPVADRFLGGEALADQSGAGAALTFTFSSAVDLIWVRCDGGDGRADPFGGTPTASVGIVCEDGIPQPITLTATTVKVFAASGVTVHVWGFRY